MVEPLATALPTITQTHNEDRGISTELAVEAAATLPVYSGEQATGQASDNRQTQKKRKGTATEESPKQYVSPLNHVREKGDYQFQSVIISF